MSEPQNVPRIHLLLQRPKLTTVIEGLNQQQGRDFENAVCAAMNYLDFNSTPTETTEGESDVIAEAIHAETPYFIVIECQAVREGNLVGYEKIGQIRGNAPSYLDARRQQLFKTYYRVVVGKPAFSNIAKDRANPDVGLLQVDALVRLVQLHEQYSLSQNVLQKVFSEKGLVDVNSIDKIVSYHLATNGYNRKLKIYSLIYAALLENPFSDKSERRKTWATIDQIVGEVLAYGKLFRIPELSETEVSHLIRDLDNPFLRVLEARANQIRLSTLSLGALENFSPFGHDLEYEIWKTLDVLQNLKPEETS